MVRSIRLFGDGHVVELEDDQVTKVTATQGQVRHLRRILKFTQAETFSLALPEEKLPEVAIERRGGRRINAAGLKLITTFEGCAEKVNDKGIPELQAYDDGVGVWTIGYGHTKGVFEGMRIPPAKAEDFLKEDLEEFEAAVEDAVKVLIDDNQFSALVAFSFNVGADGLFSSTLLKLLNSGDVQGASGQFPRWNKAGGQPLLGLTRRRKAEQALFQGQPWEPFLNFQE